MGIIILDAKPKLKEFARRGRQFAALAAGHPANSAQFLFIPRPNLRPDPGTAAIERIFSEGIFTP
jgi:hypothetical protein